MDEEILNKLTNIESLLFEQNILKKDILNTEEACIYLGISVDKMYRLTSISAIPHYQPMGKKNYYKREELDDWLLQNKVQSKKETENKLEARTETFFNSKGKRKF